tara:strand:+ start:6780 stop:8609 length:1830 start_codon:yes stop_codon:yes gene_type:complete
MSLQQQMSLFQEGGLEQDGGTVDPVSGNEVPVGSAQEEVRDDIPAQLSEGEFVFPADVVRFIGLEKLMMIRQQAKAGLKRMEEMGQMGNSEEATMPDDVPFTIDDLDIENEPTKMQTGGDVNPNTGTYTVDSKFKRTPRTITGVFPPQKPSPNPPKKSPPPSNEEAKFYNQPKEGDPEPETPATYEELIGTKPYKYDELRKFVGPNGEIQYVAYKDGEPLPAYQDKVEELLEKGFTMEDPDAVEETAPKETTVETTKVTEDREGDATSPKNMRERENTTIKSYVDTIQRVMKQKGLSAEEAVQFIKDGKYTVMGRPVPGFLFPSIKLANQNLNNPSPYTILDPDNFDKSGNQISFTDFSLEDAAKIAAGGFEDEEEGYPTGTTFTSSVKPAEVTTAKVGSTLSGTTNVGSASIIPATVSDFQLGVPTASQIAGGASGTAIQDPSQIDPASLDKTETTSGVTIPKVEIQKSPPMGQTDDEFYRTKKIKTENEMTDDELFNKKLQEEQNKVEADIARKKVIQLAAEKAQQDAAAKAYLKQLEDKAQREQEKADREAAQAARDSRTEEQKAEVSRSKREGGQGYVRAKGGLMNKSKKSKKKVMKRGGLASKK